MCGSETVEVSTFRGPNAIGEGEDRGVDEHGRILRDNVFGTQEQDATRRDLTVNALFYDPASQEIWDYHGGVADLKKRRLRLIGDAEQRFREDPIRLLRAVRFAASRGLEIDGRTRAPIRRLAGLLANVPPSRLMDEMLKLLLSGHAFKCVPQLRKEGLHHGVLPLLDVIMEQPLGERFVMLALKRTDERVLAGKTVSPGFLFAALLWHEVLAAWKESEKKGEHTIPALHGAIDRILRAQREKLAIPHRFSADMTEIWTMQPRFEQRFGKRPWRLLEHPRFPRGLRFPAAALRERGDRGRNRRVVGAFSARRGSGAQRNAGARGRLNRARAEGGAGAAAAAAARAGRVRRAWPPRRRDEEQGERWQEEGGSQSPRPTHHSSLITHHCFHSAGQQSR
jgi:poly(A) polymerase